MREARIHQLLHGYRRGHQLLAGSLSLPQLHLDLVTRLSDLSGLLTNGTDFQPYITSYPLPDGQFYALAKTWPDHRASRAGCVLTHTLLITQDDWGTSLEPRNFSTLFALRDDDIEKYKNAIEYHEPVQVLEGVLHSPSPQVAVEFVGKYFGEGLRPIVWFDQPFPEDVFWLLTQRLWPKLRQQFACCTFSLQPRELDDRPFDLLFAASQVYSRFTKIPSEHSIGPSTFGQHYESANDSERSWFNDLTKAIFNEAEESTVANDLTSFKALLGEEPTSVRNVFALRDMRRRIAESPTAAIGLMDVVASLAPGDTEALDYKNEVVLLALKSAKGTSDITERLKCYYLISERIQNTSYRSIPPTVIQQITRYVSELTEREPEAAISAGERLFVRSRSISESPYAQGVSSGLSRLSYDMPSELAVLHQYPVAGSIIIAARPEVAKGYLLGMKNRQSASTASSDLASWIVSITAPEVRAKLREALLPELEGDQEAVLAEQILSDVQEDEVQVSLRILADATDCFSSPLIARIVSEQLARLYPIQVRQWAATVDLWQPAIAAVVASSYSASLTGLKELLNSNFSDAPKKTQVLTTFLETASPGSLPLWFRDYARTHSDFLAPLMVLGKETPQETMDLLQRIFSDIRDIPIAQECSLAGTIEHFLDAPFAEHVITLAMRSAILEYISGSLDETIYDIWKSASWTSHWFSTSNHWELQSLVTGSCLDCPSWKRAWTWLAHSPESLYHRNPPLVTKLVENLISVAQNQWNWNWDVTVTNSWVEVLRRAKERGRNEMSLELCATALEFAFNHTHQPVSEIVIESFGDVYSTVLAAEQTRFRYNPFSWLDLNWDKAKDLRRRLAKSFLNSMNPDFYEPWD